ncbi:Lso1 protein [Maudiozyma humilis]|uniref:Lso1 protein n=1 Tax=Maudiozyma humilis TaxID=51915 RepID=A0AAV5RTH7_MAUHU|nr:Lso1 protein [Kazachstania humilis]
MHKSGKRYSETAAKVAAGRARKRRQAWEKNQEEKAMLELEEAKKWEQGARSANQKRLVADQKARDKKAAKAERDALLRAEEEAIGKGGKGQKRRVIY